jgi:NTE family protein
MRHAQRTSLTLDHVMASAALPVLFPTVRIEGVFYGDGSLRQTAPLSPAVHLGARGILVITQQGDPLQHLTRAASRDYPTFAEVVGLLLHSVFLDALEADVEQLERVNRLLALWPTGPAPEGLRPVKLLVLRPSRHLGALARGSAAKLPPLLHWAVRMMGGEQAAGADFLSYLVFDPQYTSMLIQLGYADGQAAWSRIEQFLEATAP